MNDDNHSLDGRPWQVFAGVVKGKIVKKGSAVFLGIFDIEEGEVGAREGRQAVVDVGTYKLLGLDELGE